MRRSVGVGSTSKYATGLGRAVIGAALFALPLFMTMEMWQLGFGMDRLRLAGFMIAALPMLIALSYFAGFEHAFGLADHALDAFAAFAVAVIMSSAILMLFGVLTVQQPLSEVVGKVAIVSVPGAMGALLVDKQLNDARDDADASDRTYPARLFIMAIGALFIALNVAPTEEMVLIAYQISPAQAVALALASLVVLHALLFWVDFPGRAARRRDASFWSVLVRYSFAGYGVCALICLALLYVFGRTEGVSLAETTEFVVVLAFPAVWGAGLAHLVVGGPDG